MKKVINRKRITSGLIAAILLVALSVTALAVQQGWITIGIPERGGWVTDEAGLQELMNRPDSQGMTREEVIEQYGRAAGTSSTVPMPADEILAEAPDTDLSTGNFIVTQGVIYTPEVSRQIQYLRAEIEAAGGVSGEPVRDITPEQRVAWAQQQMARAAEFGFDDHLDPIWVAANSNETPYRVVSAELGLDLTYISGFDGWLTLVQDDMMIRVYRGEVTSVISIR